MSVMPHDRAWTVADLADTPDDGFRYELCDGVLLVTSGPSNAHQIVVGELHLLLRAGCPREMRVMLAPTGYEPTDRRSFQPDLLVAWRADVTHAPISAPLLLAVEVLSPSTRSVDLVLKRAMYEESGVATYVVVDPLVPSVQAWALQDGHYAELGTATDDESLVLEAPFPIVLVPSRLLDL